MQINRLAKKRVVVTGLGVVSSIGIGWQEFWNSLLVGKSGISRIDTFDTAQYDRHFGGEVKNFDPAKFFSKRKRSNLGRSSKMALVATQLAITDAKLELAAQVRRKTSVCIGMTMGEMGIMEGTEDIPCRQDDLVFNAVPSFYPINVVSANIALEFKLSGYNLTLSTACSSGNYAIGRAFDLIQSGQSDFALAGGVDRFSRIVFTGFCRLNVVAREKCQPFDKNREGMIPAEGAGILLLETLESAEKRKANIYAEILGYGLSCDAQSITKPSEDDVARAIAKSLKNAGIAAEQVDYICAHGTGTRENDKAECEAFRKVFGHLYTQIPMSSIKSMLGHSMGAAAALGAVACCLAIREKKIPPTVNFENQDPECLIDCVPNIARKKEIKVAINNAMAFGGNNGCVVFERI